MIVPQLTPSDTRPRSSRQRARLLAVFLVVLVGACGGQPKIPTQAGVVRAIEATPTQAARYVLDPGEVVIDIGKDVQLYGGGSPQVGDLLMVGVDGQDTWFIVIRPGAPMANDRPCFPLSLTGVDRGDAIDTSIGVRLPKAADFDRGPDTDGKYNEQPHLFCLDEHGAIYRWV